MVTLKLQFQCNLKKNSFAFGKAPRREADSQPISQSGRQAVSQAVSQASRQADRQAETHSLAFSVADYNYKHWGTHYTLEYSVVEWSNTQPAVGLAPVRIAAGGSPIAGLADRPLSPFLYSTLVQIVKNVSRVQKKSSSRVIFFAVNACNFFCGKSCEL